MPASDRDDPIGSAGPAEPDGVGPFAVSGAPAGPGLGSLLARAVRHAGMVVAGQHLAVPPDHRVVLRELRFQAGDHEGLLAPDLTELRTSVTGRRLVRRRGVPSEFDYDATVGTGERALGHGSARLRFLSPAAQRFAGRAPAPAGAPVLPSAPPLPLPLPARTAGCHRDDDVLLRAADAENTWILWIPEGIREILAVTDHIPGTVLLAAVEQAVAARSAPTAARVRRCAATFHHFADPAVPATVAVSAAGDGLRVLVTQHGTALLTAGVGV